jgi:hypothetical protein
MKKIISSIYLLLIVLSSHAQKTVTLEAYAQTIPPGKKWVIPVNRSLLIAAAPGALQGGSLCNARLLSPTPVITGIIEGDNLYSPDKSYTINFTGIQSSGLDNPGIFSITPVSFTAYHFSDRSEHAIPLNLTFYTGQTVATNSCLVSIQVLEYSMTANDLAVRKQEAKRQADKEKQAAIARENEAKAAKLEAAEELKATIASGNTISYYELSNTPKFEAADTSNLDAEIIKLLLPLEKKPEEFYNQNRQYPSFDLRFDTAGNIMQVLNEKIDTGQVKDLLTKRFKLSEPGYVMIDGEKVKANFKMKVTVIIVKRIVITAQVVTVTKKEDKTFAVNFRTDPYGTGMQLHSFSDSDSSYIPVMREYILSQKRSSMKRYDGERLYAGRSRLQVKLVFDNRSAYVALQNNWSVTSYMPPINSL